MALCVLGNHGLVLVLFHDGVCLLHAVANCRDFKQLAHAFAIQGQVRVCEFQGFHKSIADSQSTGIAAVEFVAGLQIRLSQDVKVAPPAVGLMIGHKLRMRGHDLVESI